MTNPRHVTHDELDTRLVLFYDSLNQVAKQCEITASSVQQLAISGAEDRVILKAFAEKQETRIDGFEKHMLGQDKAISDLSIETKKNTETRIKRWAYLTFVALLAGPLIVSSYKELLGF
tara:strand:- start:1540 stop:1896 length:357 start_codon:yes stop_codon:yes gene_type:complete